MVNTWEVTHSYKYDLASFCNLFTGSKDLIELHSEGYERFKDIIEDRQDLIKLAKQMWAGGFDPRIVLVSAFDLVDHDGFEVEKLCTILDDEEKKKRFHDYYVVEEQLISEEVWKDLDSILPSLSEMAKYVHKNGFLSYWQKECEPKLDERKNELEGEVGIYDVVSEVNRLLGPDHQLPLDTLTLYLSKFSAPFGTKLRGQSFLADARWGVEDIVPVALHEMIHPPFSRSKIGEIAESLKDDELFQEAFGGQGSDTTYNTPLRFLEEHLTEGAHVYLADKFGLIESPLEYFVKHDDGSHVVSVLVYDHLKKGPMDRFESFEDAIDEMIEEGILQTGDLRKEYLRIYDEAGIEGAF